MKGAKGMKGSKGSKGGQRKDVKIGGMLVREGTSVGEGGKAYCILGFRVPTTSVGTKGSKAYYIK